MPCIVIQRINYSASTSAPVQFQFLLHSVEQLGGGGGGGGGVCLELRSVIDRSTDHCVWMHAYA